MRKIGILFIYFITLFLVYQVFGEKVRLQWKFKQGETLYIDKYDNQDVLRNERLIGKKVSKEISVLDCVQSTGKNFWLKGYYRSYERDPDDPSSEYLLHDELPLDFGISNNGIYTVPEGMELPSIRNIPYFKQTDLSPGDSWNMTGYEVFPFNPPLVVPVDAVYRFTGMEVREGVRTARLEYGYDLNFSNPNSNPDVPVRADGKVRGTLWFDNLNSKPVYTENAYDIIFTYAEGTRTEFRGFLSGYYNRHKTFTVIQRNRLKDEVNRNLGPQQNITVRTSGRGVAIGMDEVFFDFDSSQLKQETLPVLKRIGEILKKNGNYEVIVEGNTDDVGTPEYNQRLSEQRAAGVLDFFVKNGFIKSGRGAFIGNGEQKPLAPNTSELNRKKNRRVDIILKQE
jgi:outer membrane protein OmpA-like peptidoglycan-associated protein